MFQSLLNTDAERYQQQIALEERYHKNKLLPRIRHEFLSSDFDFSAYFRHHDLPERFALDFLAQMHLHKRAGLETLVGLLRHHTGDSQETADLIQRCLDCELAGWDERTEKVVVFFELTDNVVAELEKYQYPLPMIVPPKLVSHNRESGYLTVSTSILLKKNHHENDVCLDHINRVNQYPLAINPITANLIQNQWRNLDKRKPGEPEREFRQRQRAFARYDRSSREVIEQMVALGNRFHLTHRYDKRGRVYAQGYHISYQGNDWNKAVVEFADKEYIE